MLRNFAGLAALSSALALAACGGGGSSGDDAGVVPNLSWVRSSPGTGEGGWGQSVARAADGSIVVVGTFDATMTLGAGQPGETVLAAAGLGDGYVARYDSEGSLLWARQIESTDGVYPKSVDVLTDGSIGVAGWFTGEATLAPGAANETTYVGTVGGWQTSFVARYSPAGQMVWSRSIGGPDGDVTLQRVTSTDDGQLVVAGYANAPTFVFGEGEANETVATLGAIEAIVAKYQASTGDLEWARISESSSGTSAWGLDGMPGGGVAVFGRFRGTTDFDGVAASATPDSRDNWIVTYDAAGVGQWVRVIGSEMTENPYSLATSPTGMIAVTGEYADHTTAGAESGSPQTLLSPGAGRNLYVAVYDAAGTFQWLRGVQNGTLVSNGQDLAFFPDGGLLVAGYFVESVTLGESEATETTLSTAVGTGGALLARYTAAGSLDWATQMTDPEECGVMGVATLPDNSFVATGYFLGTATWGAGDPNETTITASSSYEMFVARHLDDGGF